MWDDAIVIRLIRQTNHLYNCFHCHISRTDTQSTFSRILAAHGHTTTANMSTVQPINDASELESLNSNLPSTSLLVLYFHAPWAAPCAQMSQVLDALASTYPASSPPAIAFASVNAEDQPDISEDHNVTAVPYIVLKRGREVVETISGGDASRVRASVEKHASSGNGGGGEGGKSQLPPAQPVTRPKEQPAPQEPAPTKNGPGVPSPTSNQTGTNAPAKNLSGYAPSSSDPATAPAYSSTTTPGLSTSSDKDASASSPEDINTRLSELVKAAPAMLFMKGTPSAPQCGFSRQLVSILRDNGVRYGFFNILADDEVRQGMKTFADWPTFPQLWLGGELVGGLDIVKEELEGDAAFFAEYSVDSAGAGKKGGPAAPETQAGAVAT